MENTTTDTESKNLDHLPPFKETDIEEVIQRWKEYIINLFHP